jgi:IS5 family transposase
MPPKAAAPYDVVRMFKILVMQRLYNLSDEKLEFYVNDRLSFQRFLGMHLASPVPDSSTVWLFRDQLQELGMVEVLFDQMNAQLLERGVIALAGQAIDASFVDAPRQRNSKEENQTIKAGEIPEEWKKTPNKLRQKDTDARWAKKGEEVHFGYKNHIMSDVESKLITEYQVSAASLHDSQMLDALTRGGLAVDQYLYADSAYAGAAAEELLEERGILSRIHYKAQRAQPLNAHQKRCNKARSKKRVRVEHVFGFITNAMGGMTVRGRSFARNEAVIGLMNLTYNLCRLVQLKQNLILSPAELCL